MKTGRRRLGRIYAQLVQKRPEIVSFLSFFRNMWGFFSPLSSAFMRPEFTPVDFNVSDVNCVLHKNGPCKLILSFYCDCFQYLCYR